MFASDSTTMTDRPVSGIVAADAASRRPAAVGRLVAFLRPFGQTLWVTRRSASMAAGDW